MLQLGVDRDWLAETCDYKRAHVGNILAPNGDPKAKNDKALRRIWEALDREEKRQEEARASAATPVYPMPERQQLVLRPTEDEYEAWSSAQLATGSPTLRDWAVDTLNETSARLASLTGPAALKVAETPPSYGTDASESA
jgi:hypothetical protein